MMGIKIILIFQMMILISITVPQTLQLSFIPSF